MFALLITTALAWSNQPKFARSNPQGGVKSPRPPAGDQCQNSYQCSGTGTYCFYKADHGYNKCMWSATGEGAMCKKNEDCGYLAGTNTPMQCRMDMPAGRRRSEFFDKFAYANPQGGVRAPRPPAYGTCQIPGKNRPPVMGRRLEALEDIVEM